MDEAKPSTSYEGFDSVLPDTKDLVKRLFDAVDIVQVCRYWTFKNLNINKSDPWKEDGNLSAGKL